MYTPKNPRPSRTLLALYLFSVLAICVLGLRILVLDSFTVQGDSMAPTIVEGDYVFVSKFAYWDKVPERGDIVVGSFRDVDTKVVKRVIGLPREWVVLEGNEAQIKESREAEPTLVRKLYPDELLEYVATSTPLSYRLDPGEYFLMGDNGLGSTDSRELGPADAYEIDGRVFLRFNRDSFSFVWF